MAYQDQLCNNAIRMLSRQKLSRIPWPRVNQTRLSRLAAVPTPLFALDVQRPGMPGQPGANVLGSPATVHSPIVNVPPHQRPYFSGHSSSRRVAVLLLVRTIALDSAFVTSWIDTRRDRHRRTARMVRRGFPVDPPDQRPLS
jgi:hypothetical protein